MGKTFQLFVNGIEGKTRIVRIDEGASIDELRKKISNDNGIKEEDLRVIHGGRELRSCDEFGELQHLSDYKIVDQSNLFVVLRLLGGSTENGSEDTKSYDPSVRLTDKPDMFTLDDEEGGQRAEMPCGHAVGPESLTAWCRSLLDVGKYQFLCPYKEKGDSPFCNHRWEFFVIKKLAVLTSDEVKEFEMKISENYLRKAVGIQECPSCMSYCERKDRKVQRVVCPICTNKQKRAYEFCWYCLKPWNSSETKGCGNIGCTGQDPRLRIINNCPKKTVVGVPNVPSVRACPACGLLIEHKDACKHMDCRCGQKFCFICLKKANAIGRYQCGSYNTKCTVAPVQNEIPGN